MQLEKIEAICTYPTPLCIMQCKSRLWYFFSSLYIVCSGFFFYVDHLNMTVSSNLDLTWKTLVFCFENCSDLLWKICCSKREKLLSILDLRTRIWNFFEKTTIRKRSEKVLKQSTFLTCYQRFLKIKYVHKSN